MLRALKFIREYVVAAVAENLSLKVLAFLATMFLFVMVRGTEEAQRSIMVDVVALLPPKSSGRVIVSEVPEDVRITVRGASSLLEGLRRDDIPPIQVDLRGPPVHTFYFDESMFILPGGVHIVAISEADSSFPVVWDRFVSRRVPVRVETVGQPASGLTARKPLTASPAEVTVSGAESRVNELLEIESEPLNISSLGLGHHTSTVALRHPPPHTGIEHEGSIHVSVDIVPDLIDRVFGPLPVAVVGGDRRVEIRPSRIDVRLRGPRATITELGPERLVPFIDAAALADEPGTVVRVEPQIEDLPPSVELVEAIPAHIFVEVRRGPPVRPQR